MESSRIHFGDLGLHFGGLGHRFGGLGLPRGPQGTPEGPPEVKVGFYSKFTKFRALLWVPILAHFRIKIYDKWNKCAKIASIQNVTKK